MLDANDALNDENVLPNQVPTHAEIGRQFKRIRTAEILSDCVSTPQVQDQSLGQRASHFVDMSLANIVGQPPQGENPPWIAAMGAVVQQAIDNACGPNGAISNAFSSAFNTREIKEEARYTNKSKRRRNDHITALPARIGQLPPFPLTSNAFWNMNLHTANSLLAAYGLEQPRTMDAKRGKIATYCRIQYPID